MKRIICAIALLLAISTAASAAVTIKSRRDTAANWTTNSTVVLAAGEIGVETDTLKIKIGDGTTAWSSLGYATVAPSTDQNLDTTGTITSAVKTTAIDTDTTLSGSAEYGSLTFNTAASARTLTVTAGAGKSGCFRNAQGVAQILRIDAADGDYIVKPTGARTSAAGEYYGATADAKNQICWVSYDNDDIYITSEVGTWTEQE